MSSNTHNPDPSGTAAGGNPFAAGLGAGMDFFQEWLKAAGSALPNLSAAAGGAPGASAWTMPSLDPAEIDKRIQDLKTVQFWLEQNARMIAMTIQGLEVQRMTLDTLRGMNVSMDALRDTLKARTEDTLKAYHATNTGTPPEPPATAAPATPRATQAAEPGNQDEDAPRPEPSAQAASEASAAAPAQGPDLINPMRWWDTLTQQFTHLASQAAQSVGDSMEGSMELLKQAKPDGAKTPRKAATASGKRATSGKAAPASGKRAASKKAAASKSRKPR